MNALGLSLIMRMGCICTRETVNINGIKYTVKERLGEGGFSSVDLVECTATKKRYALKRIICHSVEDQKLALKEIDYYKKIKHRNIIELVDSTFRGTADIVVNTTAEALILLPFYKSGTLHDHLQLKSLKKEHLDIRDVLRIFGEICDAVSYLHNFKPEPLAHRDLKTSNVCLDDNFNPVLMDLGSTAPAKVQICGAQDAQKLQDIAAERCSMPYRAPELFNVESYCVIDERTDIWSLGCILYAMCYYKSPYDIVYERGDSVALAVISGNVHFPEETPYRQEIHDLILFMLKIDPNERPFIGNVIERLQFVKNTIDNVV